MLSPEALTPTVKVVSLSPSTLASSTALIVTVWATFQLLGVKVTVAGEALISPLLDLLIATVTLSVGAALSTTVIVSVAPLSGTVVFPPDWVIVIPGPVAGGSGLLIVPLSTVVTLMSVEGSPLA